VRLVGLTVMLGSSLEVQGRRLMVFMIGHDRSPVSRQDLPVPQGSAPA
jgi:hypothetical protein